MLLMREYFGLILLRSSSPKIFPDNVSSAYSWIAKIFYKYIDTHTVCVSRGQICPRDCHPQYNGSCKLLLELMNVVLSLVHFPQSKEHVFIVSTDTKVIKHIIHGPQCSFFLTNYMLRIQMMLQYYMTLYYGLKCLTVKCFPHKTPSWKIMHWSSPKVCQLFSQKHVGSYRH